MSKSLLEVQVSVPSYFVCPISLELMRDPVTLSSGQTFDRCSIEKWLNDGHSTCPVTRQPIDAEEEEPIPNHVLRRMIQSWCVQNKSLGIERILTPRQPSTLREIPQLIDQIGQRNGDALDALQKLSRLAVDRPRARTHMLQAGALPQLGRFLSRSQYSSRITGCPTPRTLSMADETLRLLDILTEAEHGGAAAQPPPTEELVLCLANVVVRGRADARQNAALVLTRLALSNCLKRKAGAMQGFMDGAVGLIKEAGFSPRASKAGLLLLLEVCSACPTNRVLASEAGAADALAGLLAGRPDKPTVELALKALETLCHCAEGRASTCGHLGVVVKHMTSVSERATHHAVHIVCLVVKWAPDATKVKSMAFQQGAMVKAMAVAQSTASSETRLAARQIAAALSEILPSQTHTIRLR